VLREPRVAPPLDLGGINRALLTMRSDALDRQASLVEHAVSLWSRDEDLRVTLAPDAEAAVRAIAAASPQIRRVAINRSSVVRSELVPELRASGFQVMEPYYQEFQLFENRFTEHWQLPLVPVEYRCESFQVSSDLATMRRSSIETHGARDVIGVMGVNAASSSDGSIVLMQHARNISDIFTQAREVVLVVGLDKIVADREAAIFQAQCMALHGFESLLLGLRHEEAPGESYGSLPFAIPPGLAGRKVHLVLLDNGRTRLLESRYRELLLCIDCQACARACPIGESESRRGDARRNPRDTIYSRALGRNPSPRACLQCQMCEVVCPVGIEVPDLMLGALGGGGMNLPGTLGDYMLSNPETLLRRASRLAPLYNRLTNIGPLRWLGETTAGISKERELPGIQRETFAKSFRTHSGTGRTARSVGADDEVAYFAGCTANYNEPEVGEAVVEILEKLGLRPVYPEQRCCSLAQLVAGRPEAFRKDAEFNVRALAAPGGDVVTACSTCAAAIKHDYPKWLREPEAKALTERTHDIMEYLVRHRERQGLPGFEPVELSLAYHAPCHLVVLGEELVERRLGLLRSIPGLAVTRVDRGCCGMGGTFGMKCCNYEASMEIGEALFAALEELGPDMVISECPACRSQIAHGTGLPVSHPIMIVNRALPTVSTE
jgi:Fe-S oxidoreductase